jgi:predicted HTH domain antitoxin
MLLDIPNDFISLPAYTEQDFKIDVAVMLYQRKALTLARAARWVGMTHLQFQKALADRNVPINYSIEDLEVDMQTIKSMLS